jgi:hypothetical protein
MKRTQLNDEDFVIEHVEAEVESEIEQTTNVQADPVKDTSSSPLMVSYKDNPEEVYSAFKKGPLVLLVSADGAQENCSIDSFQEQYVTAGTNETPNIADIPEFEAPLSAEEEGALSAEEEALLKKDRPPVNPNEPNGPDQKPPRIPEISQSVPVEQSRSKNFMAEVAEGMVNGVAGACIGTGRGLARLAKGAQNFKGFEKPTDVDVEDWRNKRAASAVNNVSERISNINNLVDEIQANPEMQTVMKNIEDGTTNAEDAQKALDTRFKCDDPEIQASPLNKSHNQLMEELNALYSNELLDAEEKVGKADVKAEEAFGQILQDLSDLNDRPEMEVLPDEDGGALREKIQKMIETIQEFIEKFMNKLTGKNNQDEEAAVCPNM